MTKYFEVMDKIEFPHRDEKRTYDYQSIQPTKTLIYEKLY